MKKPKGTGYPPGSFIESARGECVYHVQPDGSWRKLDITVAEFHRRREEALAAKARGEDPPTY